MIGTKWVFKTKSDLTLNGRVVVEGWGQVSKIDCGCTYLPVCRIQNISIALAIATRGYWKLLKLDVQTAFLNFEVQEEVCVKTPLGYESFDATNGLRKVMKL